MNSRPSYKCAGRLLMTLAVICGLALATGCGSNGGLRTPNSDGFSNSNLSGTYVISISGKDVNTTTGDVVPFAIVGSITANGRGGITVGTLDLNDPGNTGMNLGQTVRGTYGITPDGRGAGTLKTSIGSFGIDFVLTSSNHGLITRFDGNGTGSGTLDLQGSASQSSLKSLAFSLSGADPSGNLLGTVGAFTLESSGSVNSGTQDFNDDGNSSGSLAGPENLFAPSSLVLTSGTNGTAQFTSNFGSFGFDVWVIDSTHLKLIESDTKSSGFILAGDAFTQQTSFPAGQLVFTLAGLDSSKDPFVAGGYAGATSNGGLSNGVEDYNDAGTADRQTNVAGSCTTFVAGRCQLALTGFSNGIEHPVFGFAAYPSISGILLLEDDSLGLAQGAAYAQTATAFTAPADYGLSLSGVNANPNFNAAWSEVDDIAQFNATGTGASMTGILDENDLTTLVSDAPLSGNYIPQAVATGSGSISVTTNGTLIGGLSLVYYVVNSSSVLFIESDSSQVAVGVFEAQTSGPGEK
ncbi:MAG: hypothetical protein WA718_02025 [Terriglobales bacterium]